MDSYIQKQCPVCYCFFSTKKVQQTYCSIQCNNRDPNRRTKPYYKDLTGQRFGHLVVIGYADKERHTKDKRSIWYVRCDCGKETVKSGHHLIGGSTKSCGCLFYKGVGQKGEEGMTGAYWCRVLNGARIRKHIITITKEQAYDVYLKQNGKCALSGVKIIFGSDHRGTKSTASLDRIDSGKGYELGNVQWVHKDINRMKNSLPQSLFLSWVKKIYEQKYSPQT